MDHSDLDSPKAKKHRKSGRPFSDSDSVSNGVHVLECIKYRLKWGSHMPSTVRPQRTNVNRQLRHYEYNAVNDKLFKKDKNDPTKLLEVLLSAEKKKQVFDEAHTGCPGINSTFKKISSKYYWKNMWTETYDLFRQCENCSERTTKVNSCKRANTHAMRKDPGVKTEDQDSEIKGLVAMTTAEEVVYCALFKWLEKRDNAFYCKVCSKAQKTNSFTSGRHTKLVEKYLKRHESCADHQDALNPQSAAESASTTQEAQQSENVSASNSRLPAATPPQQPQHRPQPPQPFPTNAFPNIAHKQQQAERSRALAEGQRVAAKVMRTSSTSGQPHPPPLQQMAPPLPQGCVEIAPILDLPPHPSAATGNGSSTSSPSSTPVIDLPNSVIAAQAPCQTVPKVINEEYLRSAEGQKMFRILIHSRPGCKITLDWFRDFATFLEWDVGKDLIGCSFCRQTTSTGALAVGKVTKSVNRGDLMVHRDTDTHRMIVKHFSNFNFKPPPGRVNSSVPNCPRDLIVVPNQEFQGPQAASRSMRMAPSPVEPATPPNAPPARPPVIPHIFNIDHLADESLVSFLLHSNNQMSMNHRFVPGFFREFPWLDLDLSTMMYFCRFCRPTGMGIMSRGKHASKVNRTDLMVHTQTQQHHEVIRRLEYHHRMASAQGVQAPPPQQPIPNGNQPGPPEFLQGRGPPGFPPNQPHLHPQNVPHPHFSQHHNYPHSPFPPRPPNFASPNAQSHLLPELQSMCETLPAHQDSGQKQHPQAGGVIQSPMGSDPGALSDDGARKRKEKPIHIGIEDSIDLDPDSPVKEVSHSRMDGDSQCESESRTQNESESHKNQNERPEASNNQNKQAEPAQTESSSQEIVSDQVTNKTANQQLSTNDPANKESGSKGNSSTSVNQTLPAIENSAILEGQTSGSSRDKATSKKRQRTPSLGKTSIAHESNNPGQSSTFSVAERFSVKNGRAISESQESMQRTSRSIPPFSRGVSISSCELPDNKCGVFHVTSEMNSFKDSFWQLANLLRKQKNLCDVTFIVINPDGNLRKFRAHKLIIGCASEFWRLKFDEESNDTFVFEHSDVSTQGLQGVLDYLYGQNIQGDAKRLKLCYKTAKFLNIPSALRTFRALLEVHCSRLEFINFTMDVNYSNANESYFPSASINDDSTQAKGDASTSHGVKDVADDTSSVAMSNRVSESPFSNPSSHPSTLDTEDEMTRDGDKSCTTNENENKSAQPETDTKEKNSCESDEVISQPRKKRKMSSFDATTTSEEIVVDKTTTQTILNDSPSPAKTIISYTFGRKSTEGAAEPLKEVTSPQKGVTSLEHDMTSLEHDVMSLENGDGNRKSGKHQFDKSKQQNGLENSKLLKGKHRKCYICRAVAPGWKAVCSKRSIVNRCNKGAFLKVKKAMSTKIVLRKCWYCTFGGFILGSLERKNLKKAKIRNKGGL